MKYGPSGNKNQSSTADKTAGNRDLHGAMWGHNLLLQCKDYKKKTMKALEKDEGNVQQAFL
jgi:hypothetical protein